MEIVLMNFGIDVCCFVEALGTVFLVFWALKKQAWNEGSFGDATNLSSGSGYVDQLPI